MPFSRNRWCLSLQWIMTALVTLSLLDHDHVAFWFWIVCNTRFRGRDRTLPVLVMQWPSRNTYIPCQHVVRNQVDKLFPMGHGREKILWPRLAVQNWEFLLGLSIFFYVLLYSRLIFASGCFHTCRYQRVQWWDCQNLFSNPNIHFPKSK